MERTRLRELEEKALQIRSTTLEMLGELGIGHVGGSMSIVEVLTILYYRYMRITPQEPAQQDRDQLVLSKGHAGPALYSVLADKGFFPQDWLHTLNRGGTRLPSHADMYLTPGIDMSAGSMGQGLSAANGKALANRLDGIPADIYVIMGDGENNEGQVWEAAMSASHFGLSNVIAFVDHNKMQIDGYTADIMDLDDLGAKWSGFGWKTQRVDGHDFRALDRAIAKARAEECRPNMIILDTVKGKGAHFAEGQLSNHNMPVDRQTAQEAIRRLTDAARAKWAAEDADAEGGEA
jgi:transketolase